MKDYDLTPCSTIVQIILCFTAYTYFSGKMIPAGEGSR